MFCRDDDFIIESPALGTLRKIVVSHINTNNYAWFLESVVVTDLETRLVYRFPCRCWISLQAGWARQILVNNADNLGLALHVSFGYRSHHHHHNHFRLFAQTEHVDQVSSTIAR